MAKSNNSSRRGKHSSKTPTQGKRLEGFKFPSEGELVEKGKTVSDTQTTSKNQSSSEAMEIDKKEEKRTNIIGGRIMIQAKMLVDRMLGMMVGQSGQNEERKIGQG